ncbi:MAG: hypothetical protein A2648_00120 [Candidatus Lloydbacteria bacterium RIFCSPHIGHO2_01_FULL_41_20]|uniref:Uncharacterized protein n=1 Tax=Candidatus Lloydbacteria bacterium RIFCSPHIGHO2_01_FULL_41_20 TaxID=1798657 RepID=A0A1G2CRH8_9BACT|nr:MAG: hypothetical protein A2648_00120 [Candidatus Lloydbacteria bacterium RIFCSPHIGHO2_01_FULL_41_20]
MEIIFVGGRAGVYSWIDGVKFRKEQRLKEEFRRNPDAVFERLYRHGQTDLLEYLIEHFL